MTGIMFLRTRRWSVIFAVAGAVGLAGCDESGQFAFPTASSSDTGSDTLLPANASNQQIESSRDVERPDIFEVTDRGLWDGRPSLGGVWVAHPDVQDPDRVVIRNMENGSEIIGALFRRERENPGPLLQVSSDAAEALGILAGAPTELSVVVLRREEVKMAPEPEVNPVVASLAAPVTVEAEPLEPAETVDPEETADDTDAVAVVLPPAVEAAAAAVEESAAAAATATTAVASTASEALESDSDTVDVSAVLAPTPAPLPPNTTAQIGIFSVEANAGSAAQTIINSGIQAAVLPEEIGGRTVWRVVAGPLSDANQITQLKELGFVDAFIIPDEEAEDDS